MINNKQSEIHGCKVNVTWSRKEICTITKSSVRFREIKPLGAEWTEYKVPSTTFHLLSLECDKGYEIGVSSWFGEVQSDWSVSWKVKTLSKGAILPYVCLIIADRFLKPVEPLLRVHNSRVLKSRFPTNFSLLNSAIPPVFTSESRSRLVCYTATKFVGRSVV